MKELKEKLSKLINEQVDIVNRKGSTTISTCDYS